MTDPAVDTSPFAPLIRRLTTLAPRLGVAPEEPAARGAGPLLDAIARRLRELDRADGVWLTLAVVAACLPTADEVRRVRRELRLASEATAYRVLMAATMRSPYGFAAEDVEVEIVDDVVVDVDFCARNRHNTGIQRVVRQTMARWHGHRPMTPVAWSDDLGAFRRLGADELQRVVDWPGSRVSPAPAETGAPTRVVVPWNTAVLHLEVPARHHLPGLAALAEFSGNRVGLIGYDTIPIVSADTVPIAETERFVHYLTLVKHSHRVAGISDTATNEFAGFASAAAAQALPGPTTVSVPLPVDRPDTATATGPVAVAGADLPLVLCVGSQEPRKNQLAVIAAAERLWDAGHRFRLRFIGGGSASFIHRFDEVVARARRRGLSIEVLRGAGDDDLVAAYREAAFTVFPSLHEGYGLPVAESLTFGVPVVTSDYGSTAEIARDGGCLLVDPRSDDEIGDAMERLLTEPETLAALRAQIAERPSRTWDDYAEDLWRELAEPLRGGA
jgi:Glycosyltransferase